MVKSKLVLLIAILFIFTISIIFISALPTYFDWKNKDGQNWMTPVKNQYNCGSCWAFSAVGTVEAQYNIAKNQSNYDLNLSEEQLVSGCPVAGDCNGGYHDLALAYIKNTGIVNESCFPYIDANCYENVCGCTHGCSNAQCSDNQCSSSQAQYKIDDYEKISDNITNIKNWLINQGPLSVKMWYADYEWDNNLIMHCNPDSGWDKNWHMVIITGYNETGEYWVVKNSWGPDWWNDGGYFKVGFDECSIQSQVYGVNLTICECSNWTSGSCGAGTCLDGIERQYTRTCSPSGCDTETKCEYDTSCGPGPSLELTVCASGCNYTTIGGAINNSDANDKIFVMDNRTYQEELVMNSTTSGWLECKNNSKISKSANRGIFLNHVDGPVVVGCTISGYDHGIYLNSSNGLIQNNTFINNGEAIYGWKSYVVDNKIKYNNITGSSNYGIEFYTNSWGDSSISNKIENNIFKNDGTTEIYSIFGLYNNIQNNFLSNGISYGIHLQCYSTTSIATISDNTIFNNLEGIYMQGSNSNIMNNNTFCPSNTDADIHNTGTGNGGSNNTCEKPGTWSDTGTTGCTFYCDTPASVTLLFPPNSYESSDGNIDLICESDDNYQLVNVTLYHDISGTWALNQTRDISGTSNITTFSINNLQNGTSFIWNCLAYDNHSRGRFASANWSVSVSIIPQDVHRFYIHNSSGNSVAWFGDLGNIVLRGNCTNQTTCTAPANSFIIANNTDSTTAYIDNYGNLCVEKGDCSDESATCNPTRNAFIVRNSSNYNTSYIDFDGDLCLTGILYENSGYV